MSNENEPKIIVDEDWKTRVERERDELQKKEAPAQQQAEPNHGLRLPPASFATLVNSLTGQAAAALGDAVARDDPNQANAERLDPQIALALARHTIDTLGVLEEKTRGNLTPAENAMLQQGLHELRMAFVEVQRQVNLRGGG